jgi:hypothetical protein
LVLYGWVLVAWLYLDVWSVDLVVLGGLSVSIVALYGIRSFRLVSWRLAVVSLIVGDWGRAFVLTLVFA